MVLKRTPLPALSPLGGERVAAGRERGSCKDFIETRHQRPAIAPEIQARALIRSTPGNFLGTLPPVKQSIVVLDLEGVLVPEIWIAVAEKTKIPELRRTTRDEPDYDKLMRGRITLFVRNPQSGL